MLYFQHYILKKMESVVNPAQKLQMKRIRKTIRGELLWLKCWKKMNVSKRLEVTKI